MNNPTIQTTAELEKPVGEKLQKLLARMGLGSRRGLEEVIKAGRVSINGKVATLGDRAVLTDEIRIDGADRALARLDDAGST